MAVQTLLSAVVATGAGDSTPVGYNVRSYQFVLAGTATVQLQGSHDGTNWFSIGAAQTASALVEATHAIPLVRGNVTSWTSGAVTVTVAS